MRYPPLNPGNLTPRQREVSAEISARRADPFCGPLSSLMYSPDVADRVHLLGEQLRFNLRTPERLRTLAVLVAAGRHRPEDVQPFALLDATKESGLANTTIDALLQGRRPPDMKEDEEMVYDFCKELTAIGRVKATTFDRTVNRLGREICLELVEVYGYTAFLTTVLNVTQTPLSDYSGK